MMQHYKRILLTINDNRLATGSRVRAGGHPRLRRKVNISGSAGNAKFRERSTAKLSMNEAWKSSPWTSRFAHFVFNLIGR